MRVLIADDEPVSRLHLVRMLARWGYEVTAVVNGTEAWQILSEEDAPKLAILDWQMPGLDGVSVCRKLRERKDAPYVYTLLLSARNEIESLVEGMNAGADDFVSKPFQPHELEVRLRAGKRIVQLQEELIDAREALREQATRDALTGIWNRRAILEILDRELARVRRGSSRPGLGVLIGDLDHFKRVNDTHGHLVGDEVLCEVVQRLNLQVRQYDSLGRMGGEEFLILLPDCGRGQLATAAERIRRFIAAEPVETTRGPWPATMSLGAVWVPSGRTMEAPDVLDAADQALYVAKADGRNRLAFEGDRPYDFPAPPPQQPEETPKPSQPSTVGRS